MEPRAVPHVASCETVMLSRRRRPSPPRGFVDAVFDRAKVVEWSFERLMLFLSSKVEATAKRR